MQEVIDTEVDQDTHSDEMSETKVHRDEYIKRFHGFIREIRWHGSEQFKPRLEDALGLSLSGANDEECMTFFRVLLESLTDTNMGAFYATFIQQQSKALLNKSAYHQRAQKIISEWNAPVRLSFNISFLRDHKTQCVRSIELIQEALEKCPFYPNGVRPLAIYNDSELKTAISLATTMNSHHIFGFNEFIDKIRQLDQDEKNGLVELNPQVIFHKSLVNNSLIKPLVLWANSITASMTITCESISTRYAVLKLQCAKLELENTQLSGYKSVIDDMETVIIPRYKDEIRALTARKATLISLIQSHAKLQTYSDRIETLNIQVEVQEKGYKMLNHNEEDSCGVEDDDSSSPNPSPAVKTMNP